MLNKRTLRYSIIAGALCLITVAVLWERTEDRLHDPDYLFSIVVMPQVPPGLKIVSLDRRDFGLREWEALFVLNGGRPQLQALLDAGHFTQTEGHDQAVIEHLLQQFPHSHLTAHKLAAMEYYSAGGGGVERENGPLRAIFYDASNQTIYYHLNRL